VILACDNFGTLCQEPPTRYVFLFYSPSTRCNKKCCLSLLSPLHFFADNQNVAQSSPPPSFDCYDMNCYRTFFPTEKGLCAHLWHSNSCKKYMSLKCLYALCREGVADESQRRPGYGVQSARLNPTMSADAPLFSPYNEFNYNAFLADLTMMTLHFYLMMMTLQLELTTINCCWWQTMNLLTSCLHQLL
jgi:hypothetical protein